MRGFVDLHCHYVPGIDDGVRTVDESVALLRALKEAGFDDVVATPHMRPAMFDNDRAAIVAAFERVVPSLRAVPGLPRLSLSSEHYFDDTVFARLMAGEGLPYPGGHAVLVELSADVFPALLSRSFGDLRRKKLRPVLAHPERYAPVWKNPKLLEPLIDCGTVLLLDVAALDGKYGRKPEQTAVDLLEEGYYYAACSDAHRPEDVAHVERGIERLAEIVGSEEVEFLLREGPRQILEGRVEA
jgi:protein-tyrosine phosphatase